ncbi:interleukin-22 [Pogona vitticeps]
MSPLKNWARCFLAWMLCCSCLPLLFFASALPVKEADARTNHSCVLRKNTIQITYIKNCTYSLAKQASFFDQDTDNRLIDQYLYANIQEKDHCYLMKRVMEIVVSDVLFELKSSPERYSNVQEVANVLAHLNAKLNGCKPLGDREQIESNLKQMKDKLDKLGENGKNKAVGELDLLFDYLEDACTTPLKTSKQKMKKMN